MMVEIVGYGGGGFGERTEEVVRDSEPSLLFPARLNKQLVLLWSIIIISTQQLKGSFLELERPCK